MTGSEFEQLLKDYAMAQGIDVSDVSPYYNSFIKPLVQIYSQIYENTYANLQKLYNELYNDPQDLAQTLLDYINMEDLIRPAFGIAQLVPSTALTLSPGETRIYDDLTFQYEDTTYKILPFQVKATLEGLDVPSVMFESTLLLSETQIPTNTRIALTHPDFTELIVLTFTPKAPLYDDPISLLQDVMKEHRQFTRYDFERIVSNATGFEATVLGPGETLMYRDVIMG